MHSEHLLEKNTYQGRGFDVNMSKLALVLFDLSHIFSLKLAKVPPISSIKKENGNVIRYPAIVKITYTNNYWEAT